MKTLRFSFSLYTRLTCLVLFVGLCLHNASAQGVLDRAVNRAQNNVNNRIDRKIDNAVNKTLDKAEDGTKKKNKDKKKTTNTNTNSDSNSTEADAQSSQESNNAASSVLGSLMSGNAKAADSYQFHNSFVMEMTSENAKGKKEDPMYIRYRHNNDDEKIMAAEVFGKTVEGMPASTSIFDFQNESMVMLMDNSGSKTAVVTAIPKNIVQAEDEETPASDDVKITKTSETKKILGYTCTKYLVESSDMRSEVWITEDVKISQFTAMGSMATKGKKKNPQAQVFANLKNVFVMQMNSTDKKTGDKFSLNVTEIKLQDDKKVQMSDYQRF
jgi:hypothetical protein